MPSPREDVAIEPNIPFLGSIETQGVRIRPLNGRLYRRKATETFHEFLIALTKTTMGSTWSHQRKAPVENRHVVVRWYDAYRRAKLKHRLRNSEDKPGGVFEASGPVWALLMLGYDLYCLLTVDRLPEFLIHKLERNRDFQSARYEIAVAAIMARASFEIVEFLDERAGSDKHCEFIARHRSTGIEVAVEAKSRRRRGSIHEAGVFDYDGDWKGIDSLLRKAKRQAVSGIPLLIFLDLNLPMSPHLGTFDKPWMVDATTAIANRFSTPTQQNPDPFAAVVATNFAHYYGDEDSPSGPGEWSLCVSDFPVAKIADPTLLQDLRTSLRNYGRIPREI